MENSKKIDMTSMVTYRPREADHPNITLIESLPHVEIQIDQTTVIKIYIQSSGDPKSPCITDYFKPKILILSFYISGIPMCKKNESNSVRFNFNPTATKKKIVPALKKIIYTMRQGDFCWALLPPAQHQIPSCSEPL